MTDPDSPTDDATRDSLTDAYDASAGDIASFVGRLDAVNELLGATVGGVRALRGGAAADSNVAARLNETADGSAAPVSGDDVAAAVETAAELHREGALSGATDAVSGDDAIRVVEALLDAYGDPDVEGGAGYLVAVASAFGTDSDENERDAA